VGKEFSHVVGVTGSFAAAKGAEPLWKFATANLGSRPKAGALLGEFWGLGILCGFFHILFERVILDCLKKLCKIIGVVRKNILTHMEMSDKQPKINCVCL
jgi:hypothetical protein